MPNIQLIEKTVKTDGSELDVFDIFTTIQGEGPYCGLRATFIRLAGCNLQCPQCDTDYTSKRRMMPVSDIVREVAKNGISLVVITGGEPFRQPLAKLLMELLCIEVRVQIETNGTLFQDLAPMTLAAITIVCAPKSGSVNKELEKHISAWKYVIDADYVADDGLPTQVLGRDVVKSGWERRVARPPAGFPRSQIYVQPEDPGPNAPAEQYRRNEQAAIASVMRFGYRLQLQIHKLVGLE